jgi:UTP--glucose-1-phosphate uridylyltransferase
LIKKCLFPVAGYGSRFLPITKSIAKEMLPILTKPLIEYGVQEAMDSGCNIIAMVVSENKKSIIDYFDISYQLEDILKNSDKSILLDSLRNIRDKCSFIYTRQKEIKGLGDAIYNAEDLIGNESFAVILPDDLCVNDDKNVLSQMIEVYKQYPDCCIIAVEEIDINESDKYGIIDGEEIQQNIFKVSKMTEKPSPKEAISNLAIIGRYILTNNIFDILKNTQEGKNGEIQITDALHTLAKQDKVIALKFDGTRFDCGRIDGYMQANNYFYTKNNK